MAETEPQATDLVLDILSSHDAPHLSVAALCRAGEICGLAPANIRVAVNRLLQRNKIVNPARGIYALAERDDSLRREADNWLRKEQRAGDWNGRWIGVLDAGIARAEKTLWRQHERALRLRGFKPLGDRGLKLRPDNLSCGVDGLRDELDTLGLAPRAMVVGIDRLSADDQRQAQGLWDVATIRADYARLIEQLDASGARLDRLPLAEGARESLLLGRAIIRYIVHDPLLPQALMGSDLRNQLITEMRGYQHRARALWLAALAGH